MLKSCGKERPTCKNCSVNLKMTIIASTLNSEASSWITMFRNYGHVIGAHLFEPCGSTAKKLKATVALPCDLEANNNVKLLSKLVNIPYGKITCQLCMQHATYFTFSLWTALVSLQNTGAKSTFITIETFDLIIEHTTTRAGRKVIIPSRFIDSVEFNNMGVKCEHCGVEYANRRNLKIHSIYVTSLWLLHGEACAWFLGELVNIPCGKISCHNCACNMLHILHFHCGRIQAR
jgi:hypothetical protein